MGDFVEPTDYNNVTATNIAEFKDDWDDDSHPDISNIFTHNTLVANAASTGGTSGDIFWIDDFEDGLGDWTLTNSNNGDWEYLTWTSYQIPNYPSDNKIAMSRDCDTCYMTLTNSIDLSDLDDAKLELWRFVDRAVDDDEGIRVSISTDGGTSWTQIWEWTENTDDDDRTWCDESYTLSSGLYTMTSSNIAIISTISCSHTYSTRTGRRIIYFPFYTRF